MSISNIESLKNLYAKISGNSSDTINPHTISEAIASTTLDFSKIVGEIAAGKTLYFTITGFID